ncbi:MAG: S-methyl-5-thioribose-1-phosphate isomerase [Deltaproteobacteria bacterium]|nr:S-methyl-5-thioribose-1-phosphate isomerase [Deltaproteobacteria bacterium]
MIPLIKPIEWQGDKVLLLDQRKLPLQEVYLSCGDYKGVADAIRDLVVRGAPAIGVAAAFGMTLGAMGIGVSTYAAFEDKLHRVAETLLGTRPTAINLRWAIERMLRVSQGMRNNGLPAIVAAMKDEALRIYQEDLETSLAIGRHGDTLLKNGDTILTHCNAGALATAGFGTALAVLYRAQEEGKRIHVYVDETRPFLQGSRLTAWELQKYGMQITVITDSTAGFLMQQGRIDKVIVGADRVAANGDVANKIGTYSVAVCAQYHHIPFYVAAPCSTIDLNTTDGAHIPIEERDPREVTHIGHTQITPAQVGIYNPAFDITPASLISAIITERGLARAPYPDSLRSVSSWSG